MKVQVIEKNGRPEWAVIAYADYERLIEAAEALEDVRDFDAAKEAIASGREELVPAGIADRLLAGENPIRVWREHRGLSVEELAAACNLTSTALSLIEEAEASYSGEAIEAIAGALRVDLDDLIG